MTTPGAAIRWVPLESNPELFNDWASKLGLDVTKFSYVDIYGLDDALLDMVPSPAEAVLLLFPITEAYEKRRRTEDEGLEDGKEGLGKGELLWFKQTIGNACGTIGLLHSLANTSARSSLSPDSALAKLFTSAEPLDPVGRASLLSSSRELATTHASTASGGQTAAPSADDSVDLHFVCFVRHPATKELVELDGRRRNAMPRGVTVEEQKDLLKIATKWIAENYMAENPESNLFNLIALAPTAAD